MNILKLMLPLALGITALHASAQDTNSAPFPKFMFSPAAEFLRSTHSNFFNGPSIKVNYQGASRFRPGIGIEYSTTDIHHDNGYVLYKVKILPVYANLKYEFNPQSKLSAYTEASAGISFVKYQEAADETPQLTHQVKESGLYLYGGFGLRYRAAKRLWPFIGAGFKGFHNSANDLDVNPHGISFQAGISF
ncbi:hypothetical protein [Pedobacter duraquae]|uniref:Outer membrane protein with beta-barrel domain n=1 Tax=Pedobacter duraquae TaxID=425511 RepID=A0A4R6IFC6_9SPHI|nr:hypothetical protein [Pedobacter duraquae]TDO21040.1 hypothetical protein CLV32_3678 [Pedobacter duraquae]